MRRLINERLIGEMSLVRRLVSLGLAARNEAQLGVRQPLAGAQFALRDVSEAPVVERYTDLIKGQLNIKSVSVMGADQASAFEATTTYSLNPLPRFLGRKYGAGFQSDSNGAARRSSRNSCVHSLRNCWMAKTSPSS